jgi:hypothetical protein
MAAGRIEVESRSGDLGTYGPTWHASEGDLQARRGAAPVRSAVNLIRIQEMR